MSQQNLRRGAAIFFITASLVGAPAGADEPGEPAPIEALETQVGELVIRAQDVTLAAGNYCRTASDWHYHPEIYEEIDGEVLGWAVFILRLEYCFSVAADGSRTVTSSGPATCEGRDGPLAEYQGCEITAGPGGVGTGCAYAKAVGEFTWNEVTTWEPDAEVEACP